MDEQREQEVWRGKVERLAWGGLGVGRLADGRVVLLESPLALFPGEEVEALITHKARHAEGRVTDWHSKDASRVEPGCPVAQKCGGCSLWGAGSDHDLLKRAMVTDLFHRQLPTAPEINWLPAPSEARRHRIQLHWDGECVGFHAKGSNDVVAVSECPVACESVSKAIPALAAALQGGELPNDPARWELSTGTPPGAVVASSVERPGRSWRWHAGKWQPSDKLLMHKFPGVRLKQSPGAFFQTSPAWAWQAFGGLFADWEIKGNTLYDLYGGGGFFSRMLSAKFKRISLVESDPSAVRDARHNLTGLEAAIHAVNVEDWPKEGVGEPGDVLLLDPPRAGLPKRVVAGLNVSEAETMVLIGCDGASFCRDVARLEAGWQLAKLAVIDLFPNTPHVECVGLLIPATGQAR